MLSNMVRCLILLLLPFLVMSQLPSGIQMGGMGGGDDEVETNHAEEVCDETFEDRIMEYDLVRHSPAFSPRPIAGSDASRPCALFARSSWSTFAIGRISSPSRQIKRWSWLR